MNPLEIPRRRLCPLSTGVPLERARATATATARTRTLFSSRAEELQGCCCFSSQFGASAAALAIQSRWPRSLPCMRCASSRAIQRTWRAKHRAKRTGTKTLEGTADSRRSGAPRAIMRTRSRLRRTGLACGQATRPRTPRMCSSLRQLVSRTSGGRTRTKSPRTRSGLRKTVLGSGAPRMATKSCEQTCGWLLQHAGRVFCVSWAGRGTDLLSRAPTSSPSLWLPSVLGLDKPGGA
mmetsp:Transcript_42559/g.86981  ORF Transcript_42559/g.86981 Transcript_42559/m.86981 type:complete len:236 (+) Transcript_42559:340-1047(+)